VVHVPKWFDDPDAPWPCPCGRPPFGQMIIVELDDGAKFRCHIECYHRAMEGYDGED